MKVREECFACLKCLIGQACSLATDDMMLRMRAEQAALTVLEEMFPTGVAPPYISSRFHRVIRRVTGNPDPYRLWKNQEIEMARRLCVKIEAEYRGGFKSLIQLSALGNAIDFFKGFDEILIDAQKRPRFAIDDIRLVEKKLKSSIRKVLFLADNAGESFFDHPLVEKIREYCEVVYVVKASPVQNDITLEDLRIAGLKGVMGRVITTGTDTVGVDFSTASDEFKKEFEEADLIFVKGMGYYETLPELPVKEKIFYLLKAKCRPVADNLGVSVGSYVALLHNVSD